MNKKNLQEVIATPNSERETVAAGSTTVNATAQVASINTIDSDSKRIDLCCYLINNLWDAYQAGPSEFYEDENLIEQLKEAQREWDKCIAAAGRLDEYGKKVNERIQNMMIFLLEW